MASHRKNRMARSPAAPYSGRMNNVATQTDTIVRACRRIEAAEAPPQLAELAREAGLSPHHFQRVFKAQTGVTPRAYAQGRRAGRLRADLGTAASVTEAIYDAGFGAPSRFYERSADLLGMTPTAWRAGGAGETIRFALGQCTLGAILVAESARGLCAIALGDEPEALLHQLQQQFPRAELLGGDAAFERRVARVIGFVEQPALGLNLPLDVRGSAFQQRVWQALRAVPAGTTLSYAELARAIGQPSATRAVARACAANPLAVAIPCHRVVRTDGQLSGYRWGVARKAALQERERAMTAPRALSAHGR